MARPFLHHVFQENSTEYIFVRRCYMPPFHEELNRLVPWENILLIMLTWAMLESMKIISSLKDVEQGIVSVQFKCITNPAW